MVSSGSYARLARSISMPIANVQSHGKRGSPTTAVLVSFRGTVKPPLSELIGRYVIVRLKEFPDDRTVL